MLNTRGSRRTRRTRHSAVAGLVLGGTILGGTMFLAGCSGSNSASATGSPAEAPAPTAAAAAGQAVAGHGAVAQGGNGVTTVRLAPAADIVYTAQLTLRAGNVNSAAAEAAQIVDGVGGYVSSETTSADPDHPSQATASVQVKIPVASRAAIARGLGEPAAQRAEPDQRRGRQPGVDAGSAARPQSRDHVRDGDRDDPRPQGQGSRASPEGPAQPGRGLR